MGKLVKDDSPEEEIFYDAEEYLNEPTELEATVPEQIETVPNLIFSVWRRLMDGVVNILPSAAQATNRMVASVTNPIIKQVSDQILRMLVSSETISPSTANLITAGVDTFINRPGIMLTAGQNLPNLYKIYNDFQYLQNLAQNPGTESAELVDEAIKRLVSNAKNTITSLSTDIEKFVAMIPSETFIALLPEELRRNVPEKLLKNITSMISIMLLSIIKSDSVNDIEDILRTIYSDGEIEHTKITQSLIRILSNPETSQLIQNNLKEILTNPEYEMIIKNTLDFISTITPEGPIKQSIDSVIEYFKLNPVALGEIAVGLIESINIYDKYKELISTEHTSSIEHKKELMQELSLGIADQIKIYSPHIMSMLQSMPNERILLYIEEYLKDIIDISPEKLTKLKEFPLIRLVAMFTSENIHSSFKIYDLYNQLNIADIEQKPFIIEELLQSSITLAKDAKLPEFLKDNSPIISTLVTSVKFLPGENNEKLTTTQYATSKNIDPDKMNSLVQDAIAIVAKSCCALTDPESSKAFQNIMTNGVSFLTNTQIDTDEAVENNKKILIDLIGSIKELKKSSQDITKLIDKEIPKFVEDYKDILAPFCNDLIKNTILFKKFQLTSEQVLPVASKHISSLIGIFEKHERDGISAGLIISVAALILGNMDVFKLTIKAVTHYMFPSKIIAPVANLSFVSMVKHSYTEHSTGR